MKKLTNILLIIASAFLFSSCGDSKDKIIEDSIDRMEALAEAYEAGDKDKIAKLIEEGKEIEKRVKELGLDEKDADSLTDDQKKRMKDATQKMMKAMLKSKGL